MPLKNAGVALELRSPLFSFKRWNFLDISSRQVMRSSGLHNYCYVKLQNSDKTDMAFLVIALCNETWVCKTGKTRQSIIPSLKPW